VEQGTVRITRRNETRRVKDVSNLYVPKTEEKRRYGTDSRDARNDPAPTGVAKGHDGSAIDKGRMYWLEVQGRDGYHL
jgi:hypothetical protein